jgi:DNA-binding NtrC family response regulator
MTKVALVDDDLNVREALTLTLEAQGYEVEAFQSAEGALTRLLDPQHTYDIVISDEQMPGLSGTQFLREVRKNNPNLPFVIISAYGTVHKAVEAMKHGATDFLLKPFASDQVLEVLKRSLESPKDDSTVARHDVGRPLITRNRVMKRILEVAEAVAKSEATVLLQGESGTGKELIARLVHRSSPRADRPFVAVNCAALPAQLLESELFGHEKGSFTGAVSKKLGRFELAHGGTILLDEVSEMDILLQAKLLRVLQEREVDRVGGSEPIRIDVRVIATTNRNLEQMVADNEFRADLYYRLNVIPLTIPPLRERIDDVPLLLEFFMRKYLGKKMPVITPAVLDALCAYRWPGNVRELQNAVERAAILSQGSPPQAEHFMLGGGLARQVETSTTEEGLRIQSGMTVHEVEKNLIYETLRSTGNNRSQAAELLGISIRTLRNKLQAYEM